MSVTVTATMSGAAANEHIYLWITVLTGATEAGGASVAGTSAVANAMPDPSITPNGSNSYIGFAITADDWGGSFTAATNNSIDSSSNDADDWGAGFGHYTGTVTASTPVTVGASNTGGGNDYTTWAVYEVKASGGSTPAVDSSSPALASATGSGVKTVTGAAFTPPGGSVLLAMICGGGTGSSGAFSMSVTNTGTSLTWTQRAGTTPVTDQDTFAFTATVPGGAAALPLPSLDIMQAVKRAAYR